MAAVRVSLPHLSVGVRERAVCTCVRVWRVLAWVSVCECGRGCPLLCKNTSH